VGRRRGARGEAFGLCRRRKKPEVVASRCSDRQLTTQVHDAGLTSLDEGVETRALQALAGSEDMDGPPVGEHTDVINAAGVKGDGPDFTAVGIGDHQAGLCSASPHCLSRGFCGDLEVVEGPERRGRPCGPQAVS